MCVCVCVGKGGWGCEFGVEGAEVFVADGNFLNGRRIVDCGI